MIYCTYARLCASNKHLAVSIEFYDTIRHNLSHVVGTTRSTIRTAANSLATVFFQPPFFLSFFFFFSFFLPFFSNPRVNSISVLRREILNLWAEQPVPNTTLLSLSLCLRCGHFSSRFSLEEENFSIFFSLARLNFSFFRGDRIIVSIPSAREEKEQSERLSFPPLFFVVTGF